MLLATSPDMLVFDKTELNLISYFAAYPRGGEKPSSSCLEAHPFDRPQRPFPFHEAILSSAPLEGVVRARTFLRQDGLCRAILLEYSNGARRAIGDCRVGIDPVEIWNMPKHVCIFKTTTTGDLVLRGAILQVVKVRFSEREHQHTESGWTCLPWEALSSSGLAITNRASRY